MIRAVLAVMAGLLCALAGLRPASGLSQEASRLRRWCQLLQHLALHLRQGVLSIPDALLACADGSTAADRLLREMVERIQREPLLPLVQAFSQCCPTWTEQPLLSRMFSHLGHGMQENRCLAVEQAAEEMQLLAEQSAAKAEKDVKLWQTLGLIGGLCLTILLL